MARAPLVDAVADREFIVYKDIVTSASGISPPSEERAGIVGADLKLLPKEDGDQQQSPFAESSTSPPAVPPPSRRAARAPVPRCGPLNQAARGVVQETENTFADVPFLPA